MITLGPRETDNINYLADCKSNKRGWEILGKTETDNINYLADCKRYKRGWEIPGKTDHINQVITLTVMTLRAFPMYEKKVILK